MTIQIPGGISPPRAYNIDAGYPATIAATTSWASDPIALYHLRHVAMAARIEQAGTLSLQRYLDAAGSTAVGAAVTAAMTANTTTTIDNNTSIIAQGAKVTITNAGTVAATIAGVTLVIAID